MITCGIFGLMNYKECSITNVTKPITKKSVTLKEKNFITKILKYSDHFMNLLEKSAFQSAMAVFKVFTENNQGCSEKLRSVKGFTSILSVSYLPEYRLYCDVIQFSGVKSDCILKDLCICASSRLILCGVYTTCTPERGLGQLGYLIYRSEGVFKLFLP